jgi:hypothetical protein
MTMETAPKQSPKIQVVLCITLGFSHGVNEVCTLFGFYASNNDTFLPMFQYNASARNYNSTLPKTQKGTDIRLYTVKLSQYQIIIVVKVYELK